MNMPFIHDIRERSEHAASLLAGRQAKQTAPCAGRSSYTKDHKYGFVYDTLLIIITNLL
jgi:hypothetical protein